MKIVQALENPDTLLKGVTKIIKNEKKEQKKGFLGMLLGTLKAQGTYLQEKELQVALEIKKEKEL